MSKTDLKKFVSSEHKNKILIYFLQLHKTSTASIIRVNSFTPSFFRQKTQLFLCDGAWLNL